MPKIPPRESVREHPLYRAAMAAQHAAYQLMRDVPASAKANATRLVGALVHAGTWAAAIVDSDVAEKDRAAARVGLTEATARAQEMLAPLAPLANDAGIVDTLEKEIGKIEELRRLTSDGGAEPAAESPSEADAEARPPAEPAA